MKLTMKSRNLFVFGEQSVPLKISGLENTWFSRCPLAKDTAGQQFLNSRRLALGSANWAQLHCSSDPLVADVWSTVFIPVRIPKATLRLCKRAVNS